MKHLVDPKLYDPLGRYGVSPLELAIRNGSLPAWATAQKLKKAKYGRTTAWDCLKYFVLYQCDTASTNPHKDHFVSALSHLNRHPELISSLLPYEYVSHAMLLCCLRWPQCANTMDEGEIQDRCRLLANNEQALFFFFFYGAWRMDNILNVINPESERVAILQKLLDGEPGRICEWSPHIGRNRRDCIEVQAKIVLQYPEASSVLRPDINKWHERIVKKMIAIPELTPERRKILSQFRHICAALL